jgi:hypothetical protein
MSEEKCACSDPVFRAFVEDRIIEPCEHLSKRAPDKVPAGGAS